MPLGVQDQLISERKPVALALVVHPSWGEVEADGEGRSVQGTCSTSQEVVASVHRN